MKLLFASLLLSSLTFAGGNRNPDLMLDQLGIPHNGSGKCLYGLKTLNRTSLNRMFSAYIDLQTDIITGDADIEPFWECTFLKQHISRDTKKCDALPDEVFGGPNIYGEPLKEVRGKIKYLGLIGKVYAYDIRNDGMTSHLDINIYFRNSGATANRFNEMKKIVAQKLMLAETKWSNASGDKMDFHFKIVDIASDSHFSVKLLDEGTRGPYDKKWSTKWSSITVAHELGHMMGLDDEYDNARYSTMRKREYRRVKKDPRFKNATDYTKKIYVHEKVTRCSEKSIMCSSGSGKIKKTHLYQIFKRGYCL